jgi:hypothetical protein
MIALAGTVGLIILVVLLTKAAGTPRPLPVGVILAIALIETGLIFYYMSSLEAPVL